MKNITKTFGYPKESIIEANIDLAISKAKNYSDRHFLQTAKIHNIKVYTLVTAKQFEALYIPDSLNFGDLVNLSIGLNLLNLVLNLWGV